MIKTRKKRFPDIISDARMAQKILVIASVLYLFSVLLLGIFYVPPLPYQKEIHLLIAKSSCLVVYGSFYLWVAHLIAACFHRARLEIFRPLYFSLIISLMAIVLVFNPPKGNAKQLSPPGPSPSHSLSPFASQPLLYSGNKYACVDYFANKQQEFVDFYENEFKAINKSWDEMEIDKLFTDEVLFNFFNIVDRRKKLERLLILLDESEKRSADAYSEFEKWVKSPANVNNIFRKSYFEPSCKLEEKESFLLFEPYRIYKNLVQTYIKLLSFLSTVYGTYELGVDNIITFNFDEDSEVYNSHCNILANLYRELENCVVFNQKKAEN